MQAAHTALEPLSLLLSTPPGSFGCLSVLLLSSPSSLSAPLLRVLLPAQDLPSTLLPLMMMNNVQILSVVCLDSFQEGQCDASSEFFSSDNRGCVVLE